MIWVVLRGLFKESLPASSSQRGCVLRSMGNSIRIVCIFYVYFLRRGFTRSIMVGSVIAYIVKLGCEQFSLLVPNLGTGFMALLRG